MTTARERSDTRYSEALEDLEYANHKTIAEASAHIAIAQVRATLALVAAVQDLADIVKGKS